jgi:ribosomal protein S18 acetylase RimI-like enzyme
MPTLPQVTLRPARPDDREQLTALVAGFRAALRAVRTGKPEASIPAQRAAALEELAGYESDPAYPIFVAETEAGELVGYLVCRVDEGVVWAESLYVTPAHRRGGIAGALYGEAERLAEELGGDTVYNWVHPNNDRIITFLKKRGYDVLNLVEIRREREGEAVGGEIQVGEHRFRY